MFVILCILFCKRSVQTVSGLLLHRCAQRDLGPGSQPVTTFTVNKSRLNWTGSAVFPAKCELSLDSLSLGLKHRVDHNGHSLVMYASVSLLRLLYAVFRCLDVIGHYFNNAA